MPTPSGPTSRDTSRDTHRHTASHSTHAPDAQRRAKSPKGEAEHERAGHLGASLALVGVMLIFLAALFGAERHELQTWRMRWQREVTARTGSGQGASSASALSAGEASLKAFDVEYSATHGFERALFAADIGVALAALALVSRRGRWWLTAMALTLACLITSTHQFTVARAQLTQSDSSLR